MRIQPVLAARQRLLQAIKEHHGGESGSDLEELVVRAVERVEKSNENPLPSVEEVESVPVISLVNQLIQDGVRAGASDIHVEPRKNRVEIRYRVDGQMIKAGELPLSLLAAITIRIKIMAELDIVEHRLPMDGRFSVLVNHQSTDLRVSVLPARHGSRIVLRVLDRIHGLRKLEDLGFSGTNLHLVRHLISRPYGLFVITGPAGSGKTSTAYASLMDMRDATRNVMSVEDPIEQEIDGVSQSQINESVGLTFERQVLAMLRQDPDVLLIGEIEDAATAQAAVRAALTGHLVITTMQGNDAAGAIPRLADLGVDRYLLSTAAAGIMSQRLVRQLCIHCGGWRPTTESESRIFAAYGLQAPDTLPAHAGCSACNHAGYRGRALVAEVLAVTQDVAKLIVEHEPVSNIRTMGKRAGYKPMQVPALEMVLKGKTTLEEVQRALALDEDLDSGTDEPT